MHTRFKSFAIKRGALLALCALTLAAAPRAQAQSALAAWGSDEYSQTSATPTTGTYTAVAAGLYHTVALRTNGSLIAWGWDGDYGQVSNTPITGTYTAIAAGGSHTVALRTNGSLVAWGYDGEGQVSNTPTGTYTAVAAGSYHTVARRTDGSLVAWGI